MNQLACYGWLSFTDGGLFDVTRLMPTNLPESSLELPLISDLLVIVSSLFPSSGNFSKSTNVSAALTNHVPAANAIEISHCCHVKPYVAITSLNKLT